MEGSEDKGRQTLLPKPWHAITATATAEDTPLARERGVASTAAAAASLKIVGRRRRDRCQGRHTTTLAQVVTWETKLIKRERCVHAGLALNDDELMIGNQAIGVEKRE